MCKDIFIIDRVEGSFVIAEDKDGCMRQIDLKDVCGDFNEGDILIESNDKFSVNKELTEKRKKEIEKMMNDMWK